MLIFFPWLFRESILGSWNVSSLQSFFAKARCANMKAIYLLERKKNGAVWTLNSQKMLHSVSLFKLQECVNKFQSRFFLNGSNGQVELSLFFNIQKMNNACRSAFSCLKAYLFLSHWTLCLSDRTRYINSDADKK